MEDQLETIEPARDSVQRELGDAEIGDCNFEDARQRLVAFRPHLVILDLIREGSSPEPEVEGLNTYRAIWKEHFCPVVVYSARRQEYDDGEAPHPLVKSVAKGSGSEALVVDAIRELRPYIDAIRETESQVRDSLSVAMRDAALRAVATSASPDTIAEIVKRSGRRRVAAMMDEPMADDSRLSPWEIYVYPPVSKGIKLGDLLRKVEDGQNNPSSFRVVLTPSCDMVQAGTQQPKVENVLTAKCCTLREGLNLTGLGITTSPGALVRRLLNPGYLHPIIPLPALGTDIPAMSANLQDLDLIPMDRIGDEATFTVIASVDSPFREMVAWAYLQTAGRPGLPVRDVNLWAQEIIDSMRESRGS